MFLLRNPRVLLALVQALLICVFHLKSLIIVTPRYLMLSTFSRSAPSKGYEAWIFLIRFSSVHVLGDFNFKDIDWPDRLSKSGSMLSQSEGNILIDIMNDRV